MRPPLLAQCVDPDVRLYYVATQNLVYLCGNVPQTTAESSDTPPIHCAQHVQQSVDMSIRLHAELQCDPVQMAELRQKVLDAWDNLSQDNIRYLYNRLHMRIHAFVAASGDTLRIDVSVWAPLTVLCVSFGLNLSYTPIILNYLSRQFSIQWNCP